MTKRELIGLYKQKLYLAIDRYPQEYSYTKQIVPTVAEKMVNALIAKTANIRNSRAIKYTANALGIPNTYKAWNKFLSTLEDKNESHELSQKE